MSNPRTTGNTLPGFDLEDDQDGTEKEETIEAILEDYDLACETSPDVRPLISVPDDGYDDFDEDEIKLTERDFQ